MAFDLTNTATNFSLTDASTYSFTTQAIGAAPSAGSRRYMNVLAGTLNALFDTAVPMVIGGVTAILLSNVTSAAVVAEVLYSAEVPTGTTATIDITLDRTGSGVGISVYRLIDPNTQTPDHLVAFDTGGGSGVSTLTTDVPGGGVIAGTMNANHLASTWVGVTENIDQDLNTNDFFSAGVSTTAGWPKTITGTASGGGSTVEAIAASWSPIKASGPPVNDFNWSVDNFGSTYTDAGFGVSCPSSASANVKGTNTSMLVGLAEDCYGIAIGFTGAGLTVTARMSAVDILIDPAAGAGNAGSSWSVAIADLLSFGATFASGACGNWYYFPLFLKAGTAIGAAHASIIGSSSAMRVAIRVWGKPSRPELTKVGTKVQTIGVSAEAGGALTPGNTAMGAYSASIGTLNFDAWWWQVGPTVADASTNGVSYLFDVAANATNKILCMQNVRYGSVGTVEQAGKTAFGAYLPVQYVSAGQDVYARAAGSTTPDSPYSAAVYVVGG